MNITPLSPQPDAVSGRSSEDDPIDRSTLVQLIVVLGVVCTLAALWRWTPLHETLDPEELARQIAPFRTAWRAVLAVTAGYLSLEALLFPGLLLAPASITACGPWLARLHALIGPMAAAGVGSP